MNVRAYRDEFWSWCLSWGVCGPFYLDKTFLCVTWLHNKANLRPSISDEGGNYDHISHSNQSLSTEDLHRLSIPVSAERRWWRGSDCHVQTKWGRCIKTSLYSVSFTVLARSHKGIILLWSGALGAWKVNSLGLKKHVNNTADFGKLRLRYSLIEKNHAVRVCACFAGMVVQSLPVFVLERVQQDHVCCNLWTRMAGPVDTGVVYELQSYADYLNELQLIRLDHNDGTWSKFDDNYRTADIGLLYLHADCSVLL